MTINPLNNISKIYLEEVAKKKKDNSYLETNFKKRQANNEKARKDLMKGPQMKNPHFEEMQLDPVGQEDGDVDNDGDKDKSDKYLLKRRKAISKAIGKKKVSEQEEKIGGGNLKSLAKKAAKRVDVDVDGDVDKNDPKSGPMGEFIPSADGKKRVYSGMRESFSNWRQDLREIMDEGGENQEKVKEKKVKNTIKISPKVSEAFEEIGAELIEVTEIEEDFDLEPIYEEFQNEGYQDDDIEEALEYAIAEAMVTYGHDTEKPHQKDTSAGRIVKAVGRLARQKLKSAGKKAKLKSAQAQVAAYNKGREVKQKAGDKVRGAKVGLKAKIKKAAQKVVDRMSEEVSGDQKNQLQQKKKMMSKQHMLDKQRLQLQQQGKLPSGSGNHVGEEASDAMKDRHLERGGMGARADYKNPPKGVKTGPMSDAEKKKADDARSKAMDTVKARMLAKYGKGAIIDTKKK